MGPWWRIWSVCCVVVTAALVGLVAASGARGGAVLTGTSATTTGTDPAVTLAQIGRWQTLSRSPLGSRLNAAVAWTGTSLLEIGGVSGLGGRARSPVVEPRTVPVTGAGYDPQTGMWTRIANGPSGLDAWDAASVWTGSQLFIFGTTRSGRQDSAALYDPATNRWSTTPLPVRDIDGAVSSAVWDGSAVILAATSRLRGAVGRSYVLSYNPTTDHWARLTPAFPSGHRPAHLQIVDTSDGVLLWSQWTHTPSRRAVSAATIHIGIDVYRLISGRFRRVGVHWPGDQDIASAIFTGSSVLLGPTAGLPSRRVNPATLRITPLPAILIDDSPATQILWTGSAEIAVEGPEIDIWDPETDTWTTGASGPAVVNALPLVWTGSEMLELAGSGQLYSFGVS